MMLKLKALIGKDLSQKLNRKKSFAMPKSSFSSAFVVLSFSLLPSD